MNPIQLASILLVILLTFATKANAGNSPVESHSNRYTKTIASQFQLNPEEAEWVKNKTVRFYFAVDSSGRVIQVVAAEANPAIKSMLEEHFRKLDLKGYPANGYGKVDLNFILN